MEKTIELNLIEDKSVQRIVNVAALILAAAVVVVYEYLYISGLIPGLYISFACLGLVLLLPVHELLHGICFKMFAESEVKVKYGFKAGFFYASNPGYTYTPGEFIMILMAPLVVISLMCLGVAIFSPYGYLALLLALLHFSSCAGDLYMVGKILSTKSQSYVVGVKDTEVGIDIIVDDALSK